MALLVIGAVALFLPCSQALRVAHWPNRLRVATGRMPVTRVLPYEWYDTPNIRVGTFADLEVLARKDGLTILDAFGIQAGRVVRSFPNLLASVAVFKFERG